MKIGMLLLVPLLALGAHAQAPSDKPEVTNLVQTDRTPTTVTIEWDMDISHYVPQKYSITVNNLLTSQFLCPEEHCSYTVEGLSPCTDNDLFLQATFEDFGQNKGSSITASTTYTEPESVTDLTSDGNTLSWTPPSNVECVEYYEWSYVSAITGLHGTNTTTDTSVDLGWMSGCDTVKITVLAVSPDGLKGPGTSIDVVTPYGPPSAPVNMDVVALSNTSILVVWDRPLENPACVHEYAIVIGPTDEVNATRRGRSDGTPDYTATLTNLSPCTNYTISVQAVSVTDELGPAAVDYQATDFSPPGAVPNVIIEHTGDQITVSWGDVSEMPCMDVIEICYTDTVTLDTTCFDVPDIGDGSYIIAGLQGCRTYTILVVGISSIGEMGQHNTEVVTTSDAAPGPIRNLAVSEHTSDSITITYDAPAINEECIAKYVVSHTDLRATLGLSGLGHLAAEGAAPDFEERIRGLADEGAAPDLEEKITGLADEGAAPDFEERIRGLEPCGLYEIEVFAVSRSNFIGNSSYIRQETRSETPMMPRELQVVDRQTTSMTLTWFAPVERYCVDTYDIGFTIFNDIYEKPFTIYPTNYPLQLLETFPGLSRCTNYTITARSGQFTGETSPVTRTEGMTLC